MQLLHSRRYKNICTLILSSVIVLISSFFITYLAKGNDNSRGIIISEICTDNDNIIYDTNDHYGSDYVEIYNSSDIPVNLNGYGLSDDEENPYRWTFPDMTLESGGCLILFGGVANDIIEHYRPDYHSPMIGFGFKYGEVCILTDPEGNCISKISVPFMEGGVSLQVTNDDLYEYLIGKPSPGLILNKNELDLPKVVELIDNMPIASADSGFYDDPFYITLSSKNKNDVIYYTLDGSIPDENSKEYNEPVLIEDRTDEKNIYSSITDDITYIEYGLPETHVDKCTVLKAVAIDENGNRSELLEKVYFVGFSGRYGIEDIPVMSISCDPEDLFSYDRGIYVKGRSFDNAQIKYATDPGALRALYGGNYLGEGKDWERKASIVYFDKNHSSPVSQTAGIRIHGTVSRLFNQKGFGLYTGSVYGDDPYFNFDPFGDGKKYDKLVLMAGGDLYNTKLRDVLVNELVKDRNAGYLDSVPCAVFLNGEYWGLYILQNKVSKTNISYQYDIPSDNIFLVKNYDVLGENDEVSEILYFELYDSLSVISDNDMTVPEIYANAAAFLDIQSFIDYFCVQIYIGNYDFWHNNTAFWRSSVYDPNKSYSDAKWRMFLYDVGASQALYGEETAAQYDSFYYCLKKSGTFQSLIQNEDFRRRFVITFMDIANYNFNYDRVHGLIHDLADVYKEPVVLSEQRWRGSYTESDFEEDYDGYYDEEDFNYNIEVLDDFYKYRYGWITYYVGTDLELSGDLVDVSVAVEDGLDASLEVNTIKMYSLHGTFNGKYFTDYPITLSCDLNNDSEEIVWVVNGINYSGEKSIELDLSATGEIADIYLKKA